jgi:preprotein translocase subunit SecE
VAQKRQRSKQRQAERRAERLAQRGGDGAAARRQPDAAPELDGDDLPPEPLSEPEREEPADLAVGAPPKDAGHTSQVARHEESPPPDFEIDDEELYDDGDEAAAAAPRGPRGVRGAKAGAAEEREGSRLVEFLKAVWAELQRVQWPNRRQLTQLTGVVLFFVLIIGAYLGALDAIFSKLIQAIL